MVEVRFDDLEEAFGFVSSGAPLENLAYISLDTGKIHWVSDVVPMEDIPEDRRGAYRRFKELLASLGKLEEWYQFETQEEAKALREWCGENDIRIVEKPPAAVR